MAQIGNTLGHMSFLARTLSPCSLPTALLCCCFFLPRSVDGEEVVYECCAFRHCLRDVYVLLQLSQSTHKRWLLYSYLILILFYFIFYFLLVD